MRFGGTPKTLFLTYHPGWTHQADLLVMKPQHELLGKGVTPTIQNDAVKGPSDPVPCCFCLF